MEIYFSQTSVIYFARDLAAVRNSEVSVRRELTVLARIDKERGTFQLTSCCGPEFPWHNYVHCDTRV